MKKHFQEIDNKMLKQFPFQWIMGWHIFLPIIVLLFVIAFAIGHIPPTKLYTYSAEYLEMFSFFIGFIAFIVFIYFIIRQIKFNSFRIHHHLPFSRSIITFFSFWIITIVLIIVPFFAYDAYTFKINNYKANITDDFKKDVQVLNEGLPFVYSVSKNVLAVDNINFKNNNTIVINRQYEFIDYNHAIKTTITKDEALTIIENFVTIAKKYEIELFDYNANSILRKRELARDKEFNLLKLDGENSSFNSYRNMLRNYDKKNEYLLEEEDFFNVVIIVSSIIAFFLWIFISVQKKEFGLAILYGALISLLVGIVTALAGIFIQNDLIYRLVPYISSIIIVCIAFLMRNSRTSRIFKILSNIIIPILALAIFAEYTEYNDIRIYNVEKYFFALYYFSLLVTIFIFKYVYRNQRILPQ